MATATILPGYYTIGEAADVMGITHSMVAKYVRDGRIEAINLGGQRLIRQAEIRNFKRNPRGNPNFRRPAK